MLCENMVCANVNVQLYFNDALKQLESMGSKHSVTFLFALFLTGRNSINHSTLQQQQQHHKLGGKPNMVIIIHNAIINEIVKLTMVSYLMQKGTG